jgi:hypothetical protein
MDDPDPGTDTDTDPEELVPAIVTEAAVALESDFLMTLFDDIIEQ